jgi:hypothetical protein
MKKSRPSQVLLLLILIMLGFKTYNFLLEQQLYFIASAYLSYQAQIDTLKKENMLLEDEYLYYASYQYLNAEARREGYIEGKYIILR